MDLVWYVTLIGRQYSDGMVLGLCILTMNNFGDL